MGAPVSLHNPNPCPGQLAEGILWPNLYDVSMVYPAIELYHPKWWRYLHVNSIIVAEPGTSWWFTSVLIHLTPIPLLMHTSLNQNHLEATAHQRPETVLVLWKICQISSGPSFPLCMAGKYRACQFSKAWLKDFDPVPGSSHVANITIPVMNPPTYWLPDEHSYAQASGIWIWSLDPRPQLLNPFTGTSFNRLVYQTTSLCVPCTWRVHFYIWYCLCIKGLKYKWWILRFNHYDVALMKYDLQAYLPKTGQKHLL